MAAARPSDKSPTAGPPSPANQSVPASPSPRRPVRSLPAEVARKIAAGEVIDRPNAIVRELLDNAVDSGADQIQVEIDGGGIDRIRVVDNGIGMTKEDLENCARPHATSKIQVETDLMNLSTLGFRGEALSSIAAVTRLQITSIPSDSIPNEAQASAWRLTTSLTQEHQIVPADLSRGTVVQAEALFENFPARRTFLKRPAAETTLCRQTFVEKALPRTDISFRLLIDGKERLHLPKGQTLAQRFTEALGLKEPAELFYEIHGRDPGGDWQFTLVIGEPAVARTDKKLIYIYANGRKINEYALVQAIDYGATGYFPNGTHPVAVLFLEVNPALVDFNIHPAKREARFKDLAPVHRGVSQATRNFFRNHTVSRLSSQAADELFDEQPLPSAHEDAIPSPSITETGRFPSPRPNQPTNSQPNLYDQDERDVSGKSWWQQARENHRPHSAPVTTATAKPASTATAANDLRYQFFNDSYRQAAEQAPAYKQDSPPNHVLPKADTDGIRYLGTTQGVYLVVERGDALYLIDQHAAHERLLFNRFVAQAGQSQKLLLPYVVETASEADDEYLRSLQERLGAAGFESKECGEGRWEFYSVPIQWKGTEADLERDLLSKRIVPEELVAELAATNACRQAVMDGTVLDDDTARQLAADTLALADPHCPHGRPLWIKISRGDMDLGVKRT